MTIKILSLHCSIALPIFPVVRKPTDPLSLPVSLYSGLVSATILLGTLFIWTSIAIFFRVMSWQGRGWKTWHQPENRREKKWRYRQRKRLLNNLASWLHKLKIQIWKWCVVCGTGTAGEQWSPMPPGVTLWWWAVSRGLLRNLIMPVSDVIRLLVSL